MPSSGFSAPMAAASAASSWRISIASFAASSFACPASSGEPSPFATACSMNPASLPQRAACSRSSSRWLRRARIFTSSSRAAATSLRSTSRTSASAAFNSRTESSFSKRSRFVTGKRCTKPSFTLPSLVRVLCSTSVCSRGFSRRPAWCMRPSASPIRCLAAARSGFWARTRSATDASVTINPPDDSAAFDRTGHDRASAIANKNLECMIRKKGSPTSRPDRAKGRRTGGRDTRRSGGRITGKTRGRSRAGRPPLRRSERFPDQIIGGLSNGSTGPSGGCWRTSSNPIARANGGNSASPETIADNQDGAWQHSP